MQNTICPAGGIIGTQSFVIKITGSSLASSAVAAYEARVLSDLEICSPLDVKKVIAGRVRPTDLRPYADSTETGNRAKRHGRSRQLETGDDDREDYVQVWSCRRILHFVRPVLTLKCPSNSSSRHHWTDWDVIARLTDAFPRCLGVTTPLPILV